jgi:hypothetical protein
VRRPLTLNLNPRPRAHSAGVAQRAATAQAANRRVAAYRAHRLLSSSQGEMPKISLSLMSRPKDARTPPLFFSLSFFLFLLLQ